MAPERHLSSQNTGAALQYIHDLKLIHQDVKPENLLLGTKNEVLLSDFGLATLAESTRSQKTGNSAGTPHYMAPEQWDGKPHPASDLYALGISVYEWLAGERPFQGATSAIMAQHLRAAPPPLHQKVPSILPDVEIVVLTALKKEPRERFGSVRAFVSALEQATQKRPVPTGLYIAPPPAPAPEKKPEVPPPPSAAPALKGVAVLPSAAPPTPPPAAATPAKQQEEKKPAATSSSATTPPKVSAAAPKEVKPAPSVPSSPPKKRSKKKLILLTIGGALAVLLIASPIIGVLLYMQYTHSPEGVTSQYYTDIKGQDYGAAYQLLPTAAQQVLNTSAQQYLLANGQEAYTAIFACLDNQLGQVTAFSTTKLGEGNGAAAVVVNVTRPKEQYVDYVKLLQEGSSWKIFVFSTPPTQQCLTAHAGLEAGT